jgi:glycosyltransferase involved in cell wall biosynthesis
MPPHVLLTTDVVGGVWDFSLALARELHLRRSARVTLLALGEPTHAQIDQALGTGAQLLVETVKLEWMLDCQDDVLRTREVIGRVVRDLQPDALHANQFAAACADVDTPVVLTLHSDVLSWRRWTLGQTQTPPEWRGYAALVGEALSRADRIVAVSAFLADQVRGLYGSHRDIRVIHNGWPPPPERLATRQRPRSTLTAGRAWDAAKNVSLVAEAAQGWNPGPVYLAGQQASPDSAGCFEAAAPLRPLGFLSQAALVDALRASRIYLSAARYDPFGLLPLQAAFNGCCLLLSDIPSYREVWAGAAAFFRADDPVDLRNQWSRLLDSPDLAREMACRARQRALERYTIARMADAYLELYTLAGAVSV